MIGKQAPDFSCEAVIQGQKKRISLSDLRDCYKVIFFYPKDFTYVCPTELHAFQEALPAFKERNVEVLGCSVDSSDTHCKWLETPKSQGGIEGVCYPLLADPNKTVAREYGVLDEKEGIAYRGVFILDKNNIVQSMLVNNLSLGRNVEEVIRLIDALQFVEQHGKVCPANWLPGKPGMQADQEGLKKYFSDKK